MKNIFLKAISLIIISASVSFTSIASGADESERTAISGKALLLGIKPGGSVELIIRTVDGKTMGNLPFKPAYEVNLDPGKHEIGPYCTVITSYGKQFGSTDKINIRAEAGHVYKIIAEPGGKMCTVRVEDVTATKT